MAGPYLATNPRSSGGGRNWAGAPAGTGFFDSLRYSFRQPGNIGFGNQGRPARGFSPPPVPRSTSAGVDLSAAGNRGAYAAAQGRLPTSRVGADAAMATLASIAGNYKAADSLVESGIKANDADAFDDLLTRQYGIGRERGFVGEGYNLDRANLDITGRSQTADRNMIEELLSLNNQNFGVTMRQTQGGLENYDALDKFLNQTRQQDIIDIGEAKRQADLGTGIQLGASGFTSSTGAKLKYRANTAAEQSAQSKSQQALDEGLTKTAFGRKNLNWDLEKAGLSRRETELTLQQRQRTLNDEAARLGISRKKLELEMKKALHDLNMSSRMSVGQYADAIREGKMTTAQLVRDRAMSLYSNPRAQRAVRRIPAERVQSMVL